MKFLKKLACAAAVTLSVAGSANAGVLLNDWKLDPDGAAGSTAAVDVNEALDVAGLGFIQITPTGGSSFSFVEHAVFNVLSVDGGSPLGFTGGVTATFVANGTGNFSGAFTFTSGTITFYSNATNQYGSTAGFYGADQGTVIGTFTVNAGGGGIVDGNGNPITNGKVDVFAQATAGSLAPGYWFRGNGNDLSAEDILSFAFTNANAVGSPTKRAVDEIACQFSGFTGAGCAPSTTYANVGGANIFVGNNGQFKLAEVPEPASLALFGIAMLGAGVASRKRANKA